MAKLPYLEPHTSQWIERMLEINTAAAMATMTVIATMNGRLDVCSVCGDDPAPVYVSLRDSPLIGNEGQSMRLCADCVLIREMMHGEHWEQLPE